MVFIKKLLVMFLAAVMLLSTLLYGCSSADKNDTETKEVNTTIEATTAKDDNKTVMDSYLTEGKWTNGDTFSHKIPEIAIESEKIDEINTEIYTTLSELLSESMAYSTITYDWALNDDLLSIWISCKSGKDKNLDKYYVYNVSVSKEEIVVVDDVLSVVGVDKQLYYKKLKEVLGSEFWDSYYSEISADSEAYLNFENDGDKLKLRKEALDNTMSDKNLDSAVPFLDKSGELVALSTLYTLGDLSYSVGFRNLNNYELSANYKESFEMPTRQKPTTPPATTKAPVVSDPRVGLYISDLPYDSLANANYIQLNDDGTAVLQMNLMEAVLVVTTTYTADSNMYIVLGKCVDSSGKTIIKAGVELHEYVENLMIVYGVEDRFLLEGWSTPMAFYDGSFFRR